MPNKDNEALSNNIVVLIDQFTKTTVDGVTYDALNKHVAIITDMKELAETHYDAHLVIFEPSLSVIVTPEILHEAITSLKLHVHLFYQHADVIAPVASMCKCIKADYSEIDWNLVYAAVREDLAILEPYQRSVKVLESFKRVEERIPEDMREYILRFRGSYLALAARVNYLLDENAQLVETVATQEKLGEQAVAGISELKDLLDDCQHKCNAYEALLSKSYDVVKGGFFPDRPRVLYIKCISHVAGIDALISVLFAALQQQYKASVKVIKLVDSGAALQLRYVPNFYEPVQDSYNTASLLQNDFLVKLGGYAMMFDTLLLNRSGLEYLIVHDMRSTPNSALDPTLVDLRINEMSQDYAALGEYDNVLSDGGKHATFPWSYKDVAKNPGTKSVRLVNHPTIVSILDALI